MEEHLASSHIAQKAASDPIHAGFNQRLSPLATWLLTGSVNTWKGKGMSYDEAEMLWLQRDEVPVSPRFQKHWGPFNKLSMPSMFPAFYQDHATNVQWPWACFVSFCTYQEKQSGTRDLYFRSRLKNSKQNLAMVSIYIISAGCSNPATASILCCCSDALESIKLDNVWPRLKEV